MGAQYPARKISDEKALWAIGTATVLIDDQKRIGKDISIECLEMFSRSPKYFLRRFVTVDETYTPELKQQSKQWTKAGESASDKAKTILSTGKILATTF